jgi:hypothetical protein
MFKINRFTARCALAAVGLTFGLAALPSVGQADLAINGNSYCSAGSNPTKTGDTSPGSLLALDDVTMLTVSSSPSVRHASDCYGAFDAGNSSPANEVNAINEIFGPGFSFLDKTGGASNPAGLTLSVAQTATPASGQSRGQHWTRPLGVICRSLSTWRSC